MFILLLMLDVGISCSRSFKTGGGNLISGAFLCQVRNRKLKLLNRETFSRFKKKYIKKIVPYIDLYIIVIFYLYYTE